MHLSTKRFNRKSSLIAKSIKQVVRLISPMVLFSLVSTTLMANQTIAVLGDSISAAYGVPTEKGWVTLLENRLKQEKHPYTIINASISGETTEGGVKRLPDIINRHSPSILLIELGGNDGLRGFPLKIIRANLQSLIDQAKSNNITPILIAMRIPPNYGRRYTTGFYDLYKNAAEINNISLVPFLLEDVALKPGLMQADGIHPTELAQPLLLEHIWETLAPLL